MPASVTAPRAIASLAFTLAGPAWGVEEIGADDLRISAMGGSGNTAYEAIDPAVAYHPDAAEHLVVWSGDGGENGTVDEEFEIRGQVLTAALVPVGADDFRISDMGPLDSTFYGADRPAVVYNGVDHEYLVVWSGDDDQGGLPDDEWEIFGQRLRAASLFADGVESGDTGIWSATAP